MLFQRLYNWIKYKTLPPSILFKNRLFIERNSQHKRIFNNFGLTFRNSKWSNYEMYNIKPNFKNAYTRYAFQFLLVFFIFFIFSYFSQYYMGFYAFNTVSFLFWLVIDSFDYYLSFFVWLISMGITLSINTVYSYFFFSNFSKKESAKTYFSDPFFVNNKLVTPIDPRYSSISKHNCNLVLYAWLTRPSLINPDKILEHLFEQKTNKIWWDANYDTFIKLYKLVYLLNNSSEKSSIFYLNSVVQKLQDKFIKLDRNNLLLWLQNTPSLNNYTALTIHYFLNQTSSYFQSKQKASNSTFLYNSRISWNLFENSLNTDGYENLIRSKTGFFVADDLTFADLNSFISNMNELSILDSAIKNHSKFAKWNRWLYRYSLLHRKTLKNSHKLTLSKKLFNSGMYSSSVFNQNIWASKNLSQILDKNFLNSISTAYYGNLFAFDYNSEILHNDTVLGSNLDYTTNFKLLSFYENSFFWFSKRFFNFNNISTNFIKTTYLLKNNYNDGFGIDNSNSLRNNLSNYFFLTSYLNKSNSLVKNSFSHFDTSFPNNDFFYNLGCGNTNNLYQKDIINILADNDLLDGDNLDIIYWLTSSSTNNSLNLFFFNYLSIFTLFKNQNSKFFAKSKKNLTFIDYWLLRSSLNTNNYYDRDLFYTFLFK